VLVGLLVLGGAGVAGAAKFGMLPFAIPGLSPAPPAVAVAQPEHAPKPAPKTAPVVTASAAPAVQPAAGADAMPPALNAAPSPAASSPSAMPASITGGDKPDAGSAAAPPSIGLPPSIDSKPGMAAGPGAGAGKSPFDTMKAPAVSAVSDAKVQELEKKIDTLEQDIAALKSGAGDAVKKSDLDALKSDIDGKVQPLVAAAQAAAQKAAEEQKAKEDEENTKKSAKADRHGRHHKEHKQEAAAEDAAPATAPVAAPAGAAPGKHHRHHVASGGSVKGGTAASHAAANWVLKSARPGSAWVSMPGSSEIRTVSVGDALPGVGKVTAIDKDANGRWMVTGTRGTINQ
jgi:hypothetical protein